MVGLLMSNFEQSMSTETALELLINQQRRQIIRRVADTPDGTTVEQLVQHLRGTDSPHSGGPGGPQGIELHHVHLPKLDEANVIEYDTDHGTVDRGGELRDVLGLLEVIESHRVGTSPTSP